MPLPQFISRLNWRLIVVHLVACWLFINAFKVFSALHDLEYFQKNFANYKNKPGFDDSRRIISDSMWIYLGNFNGLLVGFLISLLISFVQKWHWLNSFIALMTNFFLWQFKVNGWRQVYKIFLFPGHVFVINSMGYFVLNGSVMLALGLLLFFSTMFVKFINAGWPKTEKMPRLPKDV